MANEVDSCFLLESLAVARRQAAFLSLADRNSHAAMIRNIANNRLCHRFLLKLELLQAGQFTIGIVRALFGATTGTSCRTTNARGRFPRSLPQSPAANTSITAGSKNARQRITKTVPAIVIRKCWNVSFEIDLARRSPLIATTMSAASEMYRSNKVPCEFKR